MPSPTGVLLVNLGTPDAPEPTAVRRYLREFLGDPRVIDVAPPVRWLLLNLVFLPFRPRRSAAQYRLIWSAEGSPLLIHGRALAAGVAAALGDDYVVALGMRYGNPSIASAIDALLARRPERIVVLPLFPQYSSAATGSALERAMTVMARRWNVPPMSLIADFYADPGFVDAWAEVAAPVLDEFRPDHVLFSYHGLPERHLRKSNDGGGPCLTSPDCCAAVTAANRWCYRAQCAATTRALRGALGVSEERSTMSFQSRLGNDPWIGPDTELVLARLAQSGIRRLAVVCPAFVADCLETLEEIGHRARAAWTGLGGEALRLVPCLNASPRWVGAVADLVRAEAGVAEGVDRGRLTCSEVRPYI